MHEILDSYEGLIRSIVVLALRAGRSTSKIHLQHRRKEYWVYYIRRMLGLQEHRGNSTLKEQGEAQRSQRMQVQRYSWST